jgi:UDP-galactopyranose mutase
LLAEKANKRVLVLDKRTTMAGNMYDYKDKHGIVIHKYGPHIPVMNEKNVYNFLSRFTDWDKYEHHVLAEVDGIEIPLPVNFTSIKKLFPQKTGQEIKDCLTGKYGEGAQIPILTLRNDDNTVIAKFAEFVYKKVFYYYTLKMWGKNPDELDPSVTGRIPVRLSGDNRHFLHTYQVMPKYGYTEFFKNMLNHANIDVRLNTDALDVIKLDYKNNKVLYNGAAFNGKIIYTAPVDELCSYVYGPLPYRSLHFELQTHKQDSVQNSPVLNWPDERPATRRTEMKKLTGQIVPGLSTTITEYPGAYNPDGTLYNEPYYPIIDKENQSLYEKYRVSLKRFDSIFLVGRLAEYRYYNMESVISAAFKLLAEEFSL